MLFIFSLKAILVILSEAQKCGVRFPKSQAHSQTITIEPSEDVVTDFKNLTDWPWQRAFDDALHIYDSSAPLNQSDVSWRQSMNRIPNQISSTDNGRRTRMVGGQAASQYSWPWMGALTFRGYFICGASLVDPFYVITAAHCFAKSLSPYDYHILMGNVNLLSKNFTIRRVSSIGTHPFFDLLFPRSYDLAVLKLSQPIQMTRSIDVVCLPKSYLPSNKRCIATGWGRTYEGGPPTTLLQEIRVPIWDNAKCNSIGVLPGYIHSTMLCAGYIEGGWDSCQGDSGGPLMCEFDGQWELHGVISWGAGCARPNKPGVYTRLAPLLPWIRSQIL